MDPSELPRPSERFLKNAARFAARVDETRASWRADRWRRRLWWALNAVIVPAVLPPLAIYFFGFSIKKPPDVPHLIETLFVVSLACIIGGVYGGAVSLAIIAIVVAWMMRHHAFAESGVWLWYVVLLVGYASILLAVYFRAPGRDPLVPTRGSGFFRRPLGARRSAKPRSDAQSTTRHKDTSGQRRIIARFAPTSAIQQSLAAR
jgi:hypothetical protein